MVEVGTVGVLVDSSSKRLEECMEDTGKGCMEQRLTVKDLLETQPKQEYTHREDEGWW